MKKVGTSLKVTDACAPQTLSGGLTVTQVTAIQLPILYSITHPPFSAVIHFTKQELKHLNASTYKIKTQLLWETIFSEWHSHFRYVNGVSNLVGNLVY